MGASLIAGAGVQAACAGGTAITSPGRGTVGVGAGAGRGILVAAGVVGRSVGIVVIGT